MGSAAARSRSIALTALAVLCLFPTAVLAGFNIRFPLFHRPSHDWTQFRLGPDNNAVVRGHLEATWRIETGSQISSSPTIADNVLYVGNNAGNFYALDVANGHLLWSRRFSNPLMSAPLLYGDLVILGEGDATSMDDSPSEPGMVGHGPSAIIALDRHTGALRWWKAMTGSGMPTPAILAGVLVEHNGAGWVTGLDLTTGRKRFARHLDSVASMSAILPLTGDHFVTAGVGTNAVWRMSALNGSVTWRSVFPPGVSGLGDCPPVEDGTSVMCDYAAPVAPAHATAVGAPAVERAYAIDVNTGMKRWDVALETGTLPPRNEAAIPLLADRMLCVGSSVADAMHGVIASTGQLAWRVKTHGPVKGGAVYVDGTMYFGDYAGYLWAVDPHNGAVIGTKNMQTHFNVGSPVVYGQTLVIGSDTGSIVAVPLAAIRGAHDT